MSSDKPTGQVGPDNPRYFLDLFVLGVAIMAIRGISAAAIGLSLALLVPAVGLADQPPAMQAADAQVEAADAVAPPEQRSGLLSRLWNRTKAGAVDIRDKVLNKDEKEKQLDAELKAAYKTIKDQREEIAQARMHAGMDNAIQLQCAEGLVKYLHELETTK